MKYNPSVHHDLMADDDPDDRMLTRDAMEESHLLNEFETVEDGEELMDYLLCQGKYSGAAGPPASGTDSA